MTAKPCEREGSVTGALRRGEWTAELRLHVAECAECGELVRVAEWLAQLAGRLQSGSAVPDPKLIWLEAQLARRRALEELALRPIVVAGTVAYLVLGLALAASIVWVWALLPEGLGGLRASLAEPVGFVTVCFASLLAVSWRFLIRNSPFRDA